MKRLLWFAVLAACGDNGLPDYKGNDQDPYFHWDGQTDVGAYSIDKLSPHELDLILHRIDALDDEALLLYGHGSAPRETIEAVLARAHDDGIDTLTFADLAKGGPPRPGLVLSFDDNDMEYWWSWRDIFARYNARVTFFVTEYQNFSDDDRRKLHVLSDEGHDMEAHGVNHINICAFTADHPIEAYATDEVMPSLEILKADGFPQPVAFAFPGGAMGSEIIDMLAADVPITRGITQLPE